MKKRSEGFFGLHFDFHAGADCTEIGKTVTEEMIKEIIETLRRRVNALEHMVIPNLIKNIKVIKMKLSDGERDTITRLIKVKTIK